MFLKIRNWIPLAIAITALCGLVEASVQQVYRQSANDPQIQLSEDIASSLAKGQKPESFISTPAKIDIQKGLATFAIVYDANHKEVLSNAQIDNQTPILPPGVLDVAKARGQHRLTWEPKPGVRIATVITSYSSGENQGYVLVGRSLREVEKREQQLLLKLTLAWLITITTTLLATLILTRHKSHS